MSTPTPTTETDAHLAVYKHPEMACHQNWADFARSLERRLIESSAAHAAMREKLESIHQVAAYPADCATDLIGKDNAEQLLRERIADMSALQPTAGAELLARLQKAESSLAALKEWNSKKEFIFDDMREEIQRERELADRLGELLEDVQKKGDPSFEVFHQRRVALAEWREARK